MLDCSGILFHSSSLKAEIAADEDLTEEEKRYLYDLDQLPEDQWGPVTCEGKPVSETIIKDRGERF